MPSVGELKQVEKAMCLRVESHERGRGALSLWQTSTQHRGGGMAIAIPAVPSHNIGPSGMSVHTRGMYCMRLAKRASSIP